MYSKLEKACLHLQRALAFGANTEDTAEGLTGLPTANMVYSCSGHKSALWYFTWTNYPPEWAQLLRRMLDWKKSNWMFNNGTWSGKNRFARPPCNWGAIPRTSTSGIKFLQGFVEYEVKEVLRKDRTQEYARKHPYTRKRPAADRKGAFAPYIDEEYCYKKGCGIYFGYVEIGIFTHDVKVSVKPLDLKLTRTSHPTFEGLLDFVTKDGVKDARYCINMPFLHVKYEGQTRVWDSDLRAMAIQNEVLSGQIPLVMKYDMQNVKNILTRNRFKFVLRDDDTTGYNAYLRSGDNGAERKWLEYSGRIEEIEEKYIKEMISHYFKCPPLRPLKEAKKMKAKQIEKAKRKEISYDEIVALYV